MKFDLIKKWKTLFGFNRKESAIVKAIETVVKEEEALTEEDYKKAEEWKKKNTTCCLNCYQTYGSLSKEYPTLCIYCAHKKRAKKTGRHCSPPQRCSSRYRTCSPPRAIQAERNKKWLKELSR